jgi:hypothetical protein
MPWSSLLSSVDTAHIPLYFSIHMQKGVGLGLEKWGQVVREERHFVPLCILLQSKGKAFKTISRSTDELLIVLVKFVALGTAHQPQ